MFFDFSPKSATLLIFFVHGIVFSTLLLIRGIQDGRKSNYWLASFIFLCALYIAPFMLGYAGWYSIESHRNILFYTPFQQLFLMPPILYFYVKNLFSDSFVFQKKDWIHFVPAILYIIYSLIVWVTDQWVLNEYYFYANGQDKDLDLWYQVAGFVFMFLLPRDESQTLSSIQEKHIRDRQFCRLNSLSLGPAFFGSLFIAPDHPHIVFHPQSRVGKFWK